MVRIVLLLCLTVIGCSCAADNLDNIGLRIALRVYDECSRADGFSPCLKKKAITFLTRLEKMEKINIGEGINIVKTEANQPEVALSEEQIDKTLPRNLEDKDTALTTMLLDKLTSFVSSRTLQVTMPKIDLGLEEGTS